MTHDNWDGGIDHYELIFNLQYDKYVKVESKCSDIATLISNEISRFHKEESIAISGIVIKPIIKRILNWDAVLPSTKASFISLLKQEKEMLIDAATFRIRIKDREEQEKYKKIHNELKVLASTVGIDYTVEFNGLWD